jgi:3-oxoacyl-[acyl-carrier-protein] synthase-1
VVVTGFGCLTAAGMSAGSTWESVCEGRSGIEPMAEPASAWPWPLAGEIKGYKPRKLLADRKLLKAIGKQDVLGLNAVAQALEHSGLLEHRDSLAEPDEFNDRTGVFVGSPGSKYQQHYDYLAPLAEVGEELGRFGEAAMEQVHPMWLLRTLPNNVLAYTGIQYDLKGPNHNFTDHGVSGTQAIAEACLYMQEGLIDRAVVAAYDCGSEPEAVVYYAGAGLMSPSGLRPFDAGRDGTVLGEGAGALVLETLEAASARGATIHGEILGSSIVSEARGVLPIREDGEGLARAIRLTLERAGKGAAEVGMVTAHGNGTRRSDATEAAALREVFDGSPVPVTGFKWSLGHTLTASGVIESILTLLALREGRVPGMPTLKEPGHDCEDLELAATERKTLSSLGLVLTRGFAGLNSCLLLSTDGLRG